MCRANVGDLNVVDQVSITVGRRRQVARYPPTVIDDELETMRTGWKMKHASVITFGLVQKDLGSPLVGKSTCDETSRPPARHVKTMGIRGC